ncbi:MAG: integrase/recombinase XerD [Actinomycetota bacterium]|nr:integrase/recombinase XerD [Actinomycetota bacterium]
MTASLEPRKRGGVAPGVPALRVALQEAVAVLPGLPGDEPGARYGVRVLTALWLEADKSEHTRRAYYADLAEWLGWCARTGLDPLRARRADVDAWKGALVVHTPDGGARPAAAATLARRLASVSSWYRYLMSNDVADRNPVEAVRRPRTKDAPPLPALDEGSAVRLLEHAERRAWRNGTEASWRDAALVSLLFHTGLRVSGITTAQVGDLDRDGEHVVLRYDKKGGTRDLVPLVPAVTAILGRYLDLRARRVGTVPQRLTGPLLRTVPRAASGAATGSASAPGTGGSALTQRDVWRTLRTLASQAGIPQAATITPHTARRTAGTVLLAHGVPVQMVADLLGHRDIRTTRDRYDAHRHKLDSSPAYALADILAARREDQSPL